MGVEREWRPIEEMYSSHPRVEQNDDAAYAIWNISFTLARYRETRLLVFKFGLPQRFVLFLFPGSEAELARVLSVCEIYDSIVADESGTYDDLVFRHMVQKTSVLQMREMLAEDGNALTPRIC